MLTYNMGTRDVWHIIIALEPRGLSAMHPGCKCYTVRVENFVQFKIVSYLENFAGSNSTCHMYKFRVIMQPPTKNAKLKTPKFSTRTVTSLYLSRGVARL